MMKLKVVKNEKLKVLTCVRAHPEELLVPKIWFSSVLSTKWLWNRRKRLWKSQKARGRSLCQKWKYLLLYYQLYYKTEKNQETTRTKRWMKTKKRWMKIGTKKTALLEKKSKMEIRSSGSRFNIIWWNWKL